MPDRTLTAEITTKSRRKAQAAIRTAGADNIALLLQGHLVAGDVIAEAGLSAQPKAVNPAQRDQPQEMIMGWGRSVGKRRRRFQH